MIAILSDLHITDGSTSRNVDPGAFELLKEEILVNVRKKKATEVHVVLLGDIFDLVRTDYWAATIPYDRRPWNGTIDRNNGMNSDVAEVERQFNAVLGRILAVPDGSAAALIEMLDSLALHPETAGLPLTLTYVVGNHDKPFNNFPSLQTALRDRFAHLKPNFALNVFAPDYGVLARHGHEWDGECHAKEFWEKVLRSGETIDRFDERLSKVMALGEVITAELMSGFLHNCRVQFRKAGLTSDQDRALLGGLMDVNNLRPMTDIFLWLRWFTRYNEERYTRPIGQALIDALDALLDSSYARAWDGIGGFDLTDKLSLARIGLNLSGLDLAEKAMEFAALFGSHSDELKEGAKQEFFAPHRDKRIRYIVYGHTHEARQDFFSGDRDPLMYVNTGTYLPFIQLAEEKRGFATAYRMTMAFFYNVHEDTGGRADATPTLQVWNGIRKKNYAYPLPPIIT
jgi:UDP-2,3-diacylglucosamine pyrophosphatase LpxH